MRAYELISLIVSAAGFVAILVSLLLLLRQTVAMTRQTGLLTEAMRGEWFDRTRNQMFIIDQMFLSHADLRPFFYGRREPAAQDELFLNRLAAAAETLLDVFGGILRDRRRLAEVWLGETWERYMEHMFRSSPFLCTYLEDNKVWFPDQLHELMQRSRDGTGAGPAGA